MTLSGIEHVTYRQLRHSTPPDTGYTSSFAATEFLILPARRVYWLCEILRKIQRLFTYRIAQLVFVMKTAVFS
jgi:hypothetical protein